MADQTRDPMAGEQAAAERAPEQQTEAWPNPGQEGYVHPDGTPQAEAQLRENKQAAADRAAAGSIIHGAPAAVNDVQDPGVSAGLAEQRAANYGGPTEAERREGVTQYVEQARDEMAEQQAAEQQAAADRAAAADQAGETRESVKPATSTAKTAASKNTPTGDQQQTR
jgi:hypothetical protein